MIDSIVYLHAFATLCMTGLIWFVQIVHYPLFAYVGEEVFIAYEKEHQRLTSVVVGPLMLAEAATAGILLFIAPGEESIGLPLLGLMLLAVIWVSTAFVQVPLHRSLEEGFNTSRARLLVRTNWVRTIAWSARGCVAIAMLQP